MCSLSYPLIPSASHLFDTLKWKTYTLEREELLLLLGILALNLLRLREQMRVLIGLEWAQKMEGSCCLGVELLETENF